MEFLDKLEVDTKLKDIKIDLIYYKNLIENNPCHIATVSKTGKPNLSVAADIKIIDNNTILISHNEMLNTPNNIKDNGFVVITSFNDNWEGLRITGNAKYYTDGKYFEKCNKLFKNEKTTPKGAIVIYVGKVESIS